MNICLKVNVQKEKAVNYANEVINLLLENDVSVLMKEDVRDFFQNNELIHYYEDDNRLFSDADCVITVGGDGTIIHNALFAAKNNIPLVGVNAGRVGYAAEIEFSEINLLKKILKGDYEVEQRMILEVSIEKSDETLTYYCINEVVISRGQLSRIIDMTLFVNDEKTMNYRADGLIFATPTGSTAYSLSAGGPVVEPTMQCIVMTPICPYALMDKTLIFSEGTSLAVVANRHSAEDEKSYVTIDGQTVIPLSSKDKVTIRRSPLTLKLISLKKRNFCRLVGQKLKEDY
ncbi:MAG: NAD(+)/NADH kinase [Ruminococcus sp.]|nr:NAD(+)/NADH kinase [Ruminococcus sp.]